MTNLSILIRPGLGRFNEPRREPEGTWPVKGNVPERSLRNEDEPGSETISEFLPQIEDRQDRSRRIIGLSDSNPPE